MSNKIWILEIGEPLPLEPDVRLHRYGQYSHFLGEKGWDVTWWTSSFSHAPKKHLVDEDCVKMHGKAKIQFIKGLGYPKNVSLARIRHNAHFAKRFLEMAESYDKPDLIIAPVPTVNIAKAAVQFGKKHNVPVLTDIRDLWPDELVDILPKPARPLGRLLLTKSFKDMESVCKNATGIMGVSNDFIDYGLKFAKRQRGPNDFLFPLGYSSKALSPTDLEKGEKWFEKTFGTNTPFTICFIGTIGRFFDLKTVIDAARRLPKIRFVLAGEGSHLSIFKKMAEGLDNVYFPGWIKGPQIQALMKHSHVGLAPYCRDAKMTLPNKPFEYMAGGLPIISSLTGDLRDLIEEKGFGVNYQADSVDELIQAIEKIKKNPNLQKEMGKKSRALLNERFSTEIVFENTQQFLKTFCKPKDQRSSQPSPTATASGTPSAPMSTSH
ncbi:MAG: glycosyltransferase family 4 protein [Bdellovibrionales bacterium]|nr:glycosyltransferase family 4 protein [Bdellovibrionales bacterium]